MSDPAHAEEQRPRQVRVLDVDPDLGADLRPDALATATSELVAPLFDVTWTTRTAQWGFRAAAVRLGLLVVDGLVFREVQMLGTRSAELLGSGDLLRPGDMDGDDSLPVPVEVRWTVLAPLSVAALDEPFLANACGYPEVLARLVGRAVARSKAQALQLAITNLKHVETRVLVEFWHLAERWGRVGPSGVRIQLPLTHELLAKLVGAARPSVTTALGHLADRGLLRRDGESWLLSHESRHALPARGLSAH
jgi:CRP/FNR family transcriptional regulator, cyclic AMP receptor protein